MSLVADLLLRKTPPPPPACELGRTGAVFRHSADERVVKPIFDVPHHSENPEKVTQDRKSMNRAEILSLIRAGYDTYAKVSSASTGRLSRCTVLNHVKALAQDGLIAIEQAKQTHLLRAKP